MLVLKLALAGMRAFAGMKYFNIIFRRWFFTVWRHRFRAQTQSENLKVSSLFESRSTKTIKLSYSSFALECSVMNSQLNQEWTTLVQDFCYRFKNYQLGVSCCVFRPAPHHVCWMKSLFDATTGFFYLLLS